MKESKIQAPVRWLLSSSVPTAWSLSLLNLPIGCICRLCLPYESQSTAKLYQLSRGNRGLSPESN